MRSATQPCLWLLAAVTMLSVACTAAPEKRPATGEGYVVTPDSTRLFYRVAGAGRDTIIALHGGPAGSLDEIFTGFAPLTEHHVVIFYDQRGGGRSSLPTDTTRLAAARQISDLDEVRRHFGLNAVHLVGHSYGVLLAASYALEHPAAVSSMVLIAGVGPNKGRLFERLDSITRARLGPALTAQLASAYKRVADPRADAIQACRDFTRIVLASRLANPDSMLPRLMPHFCHGDAAAIRYSFYVANPATFNSYGAWDLREHLRALQVPTLVVHGTDDVIPMDVAEEWTMVLPHATLMRVPDAGHFLFEERPELVWPEIERFLAIRRQ
jgi:proline iminopeptidase